MPKSVVDKQADHHHHTTRCCVVVCGGLVGGHFTTGVLTVFEGLRYCYASRISAQANSLEISARRLPLGSTRADILLSPLFFFCTLTHKPVCGACAREKNEVTRTPVVAEFR